jgi:hypothetical protein
MRTELGLLKRPVLPATNTVGALQQFQTEIASLAFGRTHWAWKAFLLDLHEIIFSFVKNILLGRAEKL